VAKRFSKRARDAAEVGGAAASPCTRFMSMAEEFDAIADKVNASPETLTPEVMGALAVAIEVGHSFIAEVGAALDEVSQ